MTLKKCCQEVRDSGRIAKARDRLAKATVYWSMERWAGTVGSPQADMLREAYENLADKHESEPVSIDQPKSPAVA
ncbi:MAG TPA: hypothetical protein VNA15_10715 [Candidatus Angelobacter sp.]|nr:hypothetical protein [Candidatus Angelobacter sp.]